MLVGDALRLNRLLQLCSANLPVGGFSFSQGLEYAVEMGWVNDVDSTSNWVELNLSQSIARTDLAIIKRQYEALLNDDLTAFISWNQHLIACRESNELHLADVAMGKALIRLLKQLDSAEIQQGLQRYEALLDVNKIGTDISFVSAFVLIASLFKLDLLLIQSGYCWTYIDNQVAAATKLVPLGQTQAQNLLFEITEKVDASIQLANTLQDDEIGASLPRLAMASAWHETQYTRLFRS
ncbi:urease accessory protein UreF [Pseudocolwellia agarivorans]|uniref:urease accessory protein UreF n=1 Tax=Pseudocolwellia agarivorans TaxID=1911682 RepID=UPI000986E448|nr:urease accessory UreF family protein [Pseudocolwellia agarivorans]